MVDDLRSAGLLQRDEIVERNHLAGVALDVELTQVAGVAAELLVGLDVDTVGPVVEIEVVDVSRTHVDAHGGRDLRQWHAHGLSLGTVDGDEELRVVGGELRVQTDQARSRRVRLGDSRVSDAIDVGKGVAALILQDELEAADGADALDGGRFGCKQNTARNTEQLGPNAAHDRCGVVSSALLGALIHGLQRCEDDARVG